MVRGGSRLFKIGGPSGWYNECINYGLRIVFILVYYYALTTQMAQPILPTNTNAYVLINEREVDYDQSVAGSFMVELLEWIAWVESSILRMCFLVWSFLMKSMSGVMSFFCDGYFCDIMLPQISRSDRRRVQVFRSTYVDDPLLAVDERYLLFSGLMLSREISYVFSCNAKWQVYVTNIRQQYEAIILLPLTLSTSVSPLWPPNGIIMAIMVFLAIIGVQLFILFFGVIYIIFFRFKTSCTLYFNISKIVYYVLWLRMCKFSMPGYTDIFKQINSFCLGWFRCAQLIFKDTVLWWLLLLHKFRIHPASQKQFPNKHVLASYALSSDDMVCMQNIQSFDSDSQSCVCDNSANTHIWNNLKDFIPSSLVQLTASTSSSVVTIGGSNFHPTSIGNIKITWNDDNGVPYQTVLKNVLYFPDSPVNVLSVTAFASQLNDDNGTWIKTARHQSVFSWDHEKYTKTLIHPASNLPQMTVNSGFSIFTSFCKFLEKATVLPSLGASVFLSGGPVGDDTTDSASSTTASPLSSIEQSVKDQYTIGQTLSLVRDGHSETVTLESVDLDMDQMIPYFTVKLPNGLTTSVCKEFLRHADDKNMSHIPVTVDEIREQAAFINPEVLQALLKPTVVTPLMQEFMDLHDVLRHMPFPVMFKLCQDEKLPKKFLALQQIKLLCPSCIFGQCKRTPWRKGSRPAGKVCTPCITVPGDKAHIDQMQSNQPGLVPRMKGRHTKSRISAVTVFLDDKSNHSFSHLQTSTGGDETLAAKHAYEIMADSFGVAVRGFHADNGIFAEKLFVDEVTLCNQTISFCGVGAHHQNGKVESHIGRLTRGSRTLLLSAQRRWPEAIGEILWPFAWKDYERCYNELSIGSDGLTPIEKFSSTEREIRLRDYHPWGCPVYVLEGNLQSVGSKFPKWDPRARLGVYLGRSPCHAGNVALVLNPRTLHVSPQFHVTFDDKFITVPFLRSGDVPPSWSALVQNNTESATDEAFDLSTTWMDVESGQPLGGPSNEEVIGVSSVDKLVAPPATSTYPVVTSVSEEALVDDYFDYKKGTTTDLPTTVASEEATNVVSEEAQPVSANLEKVTHRPAASKEASSSHEPKPYRMTGLPNLDDMSLRRSKRSQKPSEKGAAIRTSAQKKFFNLFSTFCLFTVAALTTSANLVPSTMAQKVVLHAEKFTSNFDGTLNSFHHAALMAAPGDNDTYTFKNMLQEDDKNEFISAMMKEIKDHEDRNHWDVMLRDDLPKGAKTILAIWSFKRKRFPDGRVQKYKARICAHGGMQTWGENYWETYAPVVNWLSVRTLLIISMLNDLETRSIDFTLAFPQAKLDVDVYMELPVGFDNGGCSGRHVLKLNKSLYGLKQAAFNWFQLLKQGLEDRGYKHQSNTDKCVFLGKSSIILVYVDDCIIISKKGSGVAKRLIKSLLDGNEHFQLTDEGNLDRYLGVEITKLKDRRVELTQPHLINRFLAVVQQESNINEKPTPATKPLLHKDIDGLPRKFKWNYRQAIGMLTYLQGTSRPDIAMAVHQAARFTNDPKLSHERAVHRIARYLKATKDKGIIYDPKSVKGVECYVDADFAGGWDKADSGNPEAVLSRTGYVLMYANCPVLWCSKLQTEIALSTTEAEYIALSQSMREVIPFMTLLQEIDKIFSINTNKARFHCKVFEDNNSCISLAKSEKFSPRTKHIALKYHHFRRFILDNTVEIFPIDTREQLADIFTKPLDEDLFLYLRGKQSGW